MVVPGLRRASSNTATSLRPGALAIAFRNRAIQPRSATTHSNALQTDAVDVPPNTGTVSPAAVHADGPRRSTGRMRYNRGRRVSTLNPSQLTPGEFLNISNIHFTWIRAYPTVYGHGRPGAFVGRTTHIHLQASGMHNRRFPDDALGYLYYHLPPNAPQLAGQVRFRITGTNDPALFSSGHDLHRADGLPWRVPLLAIASRAVHTALRQRILDDGLVSERLLDFASTGLPTVAKMVNIGSTRVLHAFGQPFLLKLGQSNQLFYFIGADTVRQGKIAATSMYYPPGRLGVRLPLLKGSALCCFEKSALPEHAGRRVVVCRVLRIVEPVTHTGVLPVKDELLPRKGGLMRTRLLYETRHPGRIFDLDRPQTRGHHDAEFMKGLQLLYENEERAGVPVGW